MLRCAQNKPQQDLSAAGASAAGTSPAAAGVLCLVHHSTAFWNIRIHGDTSPAASHLSAMSCGMYAHCQGRVARSGCGISAKCRPSAEQRPAIDIGDPFGQNGYSDETAPLSSAYWSATRFWSRQD